eukprot:g5283.t1
MNFSGHNTRHDKQENELQSIADLPKFLRWGIYLTPTRWKKTYMAFIAFSQIGLSIPIFSFITSSLAVGIVFATINILFFAVYTLQPDFTKVVFLDMLLKDAKTTKKINDNIINATIGGVIFNFLVLMPMFWIFLIYPFATMQPGMLGKYTYEITMVFGILGQLCQVASFIFSYGDYLPDQISLVHIQKIKKYLLTVRDLILNDTAEEDGMPLVDKLSMEQEKVEKWILEINKGISTFNSISIVGMSGYIIFFLNIAGGGYGVGTSVVFSGMSLFIFMFFSSSLYAIAKPNMVWEQQKILILNNPKVISAVLQKLKFPKENFESWLNLHNINASRAFGTKITFEKMKQAAGVLTSVFGVVMYLLLREELRSQGYL